MKKQRGLMTERVYIRRTLNYSLWWLLAGIAAGAIFLFLPSPR